MGKKSAREATNLFKGLEDVDVKPSKQDELGFAVEHTVTKNGPVKSQGAAPTKKPPGLSAKARGRKRFEDIDPILEEMLVHPEATVSRVASAEDLQNEDVHPTKATKASPQDQEKSTLSVVREEAVLELEDEEKTPVPVAVHTEPESSARESFDDKTQKIQSMKVMEVPEHSPSYSQPMNSSSASGMGLEDQLRSANYLELAQNRVLELEKEVQKLRRDNEQLSSAGQHFKELTESIKQQLKQSEANFTNLKEIAEEEKKILTQSLEAKEIKIGALQERLIELEEKINSSFDHVRIRERELENRLEIMKTESEAVMSSKDEMILDLKKQLNLVNSDLEKYRIQNQKIAAKMEGKEELLRRTVKALRIALTMLEGSRPDDDN